MAAARRRDRQTSVMTNSKQWTRVIVLAPSDDGLKSPAALQRIFEEREWYAIERSDPYDAMVELCLRERAQSARSAWGVGRLEDVALVIVHADHWDGSALSISDLIDAVTTHVPEASIWEFVGNTLRRIHAGAIDMSRDESLSDSANEPATETSESMQPLGWPDEAIELKESGLHQSSSARRDTMMAMRLTREEIDMLLDDREPALEREVS